MATCGNLNCRGPFEPARAWQKFCSTRCRHQARHQGISHRRAGDRIIREALVWFAAGGGFSPEARLRDACEAYQLYDQERKP
jgi:hypothetical protein